MAFEPTKQSDGWREARTYVLLIFMVLRTALLKHDQRFHLHVVWNVAPRVVRRVLPALSRSKYACWCVLVSPRMHAYSEGIYMACMYYSISAS